MEDYQMADEQPTSGQAPQQDPQGGQSQRTSQEQPGGEGQQTQQAEGKGAQKSQQQQKVNLHDLPEFKQVQRSWQQKIEATQREAAQLRQQVQQLEEKGLDDYGKLELQLQRREQELQQYQQYIQTTEQERQIAQARDEQLGLLAQKFSVPKAELDRDDVDSYDKALDLAIQLREQKAQEKQSETNQKKQAHKPDLGGGGSTPQTRAREDFANAKTSWEVAKQWWGPGDS